MFPGEQVYMVSANYATAPDGENVPDLVQIRAKLASNGKAPSGGTFVVTGVANCDPGEGTNFLT